MQSTVVAARMRLGNTSDKFHCCRHMPMICRPMLYDQTIGLLVTVAPSVAELIGFTCHVGAGMLMSSALFRQGQYSDIVDWIWSLGDISSGGDCPAHAGAFCQVHKTMLCLVMFPRVVASHCYLSVISSEFKQLSFCV